MPKLLRRNWKCFNLQSCKIGGKGQSKAKQIGSHLEDIHSSPPQCVAASDAEFSCDESLSSSGDVNYFELEKRGSKIKTRVSTIFQAD